MDVKLVKNEQDLEKIGPVMLQLRNQFDQDSLINQIKQQQQNGYQMAYVEENGHVLCVAGFIIATKLAWGRHIYVDDLVSDTANRSAGAGKLMMDWLKNHARENNCVQIQLDSGVNRFGAHKFYLREGFYISSHHFSLTEPGTF